MIADLTNLLCPEQQQQHSSEVNTSSLLLHHRLFPLLVEQITIGLAGTQQLYLSLTNHYNLLQGAFLAIFHSKQRH
ncbi:unnamed protein product [Onchocerca flexuosa]|uniref:Uncharacterized protein n=1 Tax=Onchocerca flexuosa TaxID=387005 RepID=A0A183H550_9BILA|nr:unnamed protein product [Onchocerca flexuosa]